MTITVDNVGDVFHNGEVVFSNDAWTDSHTIRLFEPCVLAIRGEDFGVIAGILASTSTGVVTDKTWKCSGTLEAGWDLTGFNDSHWEDARITGVNGDAPWGLFADIDPSAKWIWSSGENDTVAYCRKEICVDGPWTGVCVCVLLCLRTVFANSHCHVILSR